MVTPATNRVGHNPDLFGHRAEYPRNKTGSFVKIIFLFKFLDGYSSYVTLGSHQRVNKKFYQPTNNYFLNKNGQGS